jgi:hypothetical protein
MNASTNNFNITELQKYLNNIFEIESKMRVKDLRISLLEFEVALQKQLLASFKKHVNFSLEKVKL